MEPTLVIAVSAAVIVFVTLVLVVARIVCRARQAS